MFNCPLANPGCLNLNALTNVSRDCKGMVVMVLSRGTKVWSLLPDHALIQSLKSFGPEISHIYKRETYLNYFFPHHFSAMDSMSL